VRSQAKASTAGSTQRQADGRGRFARRVAFPLGLLLAIGLLLLPSSALALTKHVFSESFGSAGSGDGQLELAAHSGIAVNDQTGDIYVADTGNHRIDQFDSSGAFIRAFGADVGGAGIDVCTTGCAAGTSSSAPGGFEAPTFIAVDNSAGGSNGDVYVADTADNLVTKFDQNGALLSGWGSGGQLNGSTATDGPFNKEGASITGVAVDTAGTLYVGNTAKRIFEFEESGVFSEDFLASGFFSIASGIAVNSAGDIYKFLTAGGAISKLNATGEFLIVIVDFGTGMAVDTSNDNLYVAHPEEISHYDSETTAQEKPFGLGHLGSAAGLGVNSSTHTVYVTSSGHEVAVFEQVIVPDVTTEEATAIGAEGATLHGTISAAEGPEASCEFQYTSEEAFDEEGFEGAQTAPCSPAGPFTGSGSEAVSAEVNGLAVGTTYFFRLVGINEKGTNPDLASKEGTLSFRTLGPSIVAGGATDITATAARITGLIETNGEATTYHVEYGLTESYGSIAPVPDGAAGLPLGTGNFEFGSKKITNVAMSQGAFAVGQEIEGESIPPGTTVTKIEGSTLKLSDFTTGEGFFVSLSSTTAAISQGLKGLAPGTQYHFRLLAGGVASVFGPDQTFSTFPQEGAGGRAYEQVSPAQKLGEVFAPEPSGSLGGSCADFCLPGLNDIMMPMQVTSDGEALAFEGQPFSADLPPGGNQYIAHRSAGGWASSGITPPLATAGRDDGESGFKAFSADLSRGVLFQSTRPLSPEAPMGENGKSFNNLYLRAAGQEGLRPLVTVEPPNRDALEPQASNAFEILFAAANSGTAASPAFTHLVFEANDALTPTVPGIAPAAPEAEEGSCGFPESNCNLYEWVGGKLRLVNALPDNETAAAHAVIGSGRWPEGALGSNADPHTQAADADHAISDDGSRIFWSDESGQLFIRIDGKETVEVQDPGQFLTATPDGSKVLLSDGCIYDVEAESCEATLGNSASAFLGIMGASEDLSRVYFLDSEALTGGAQPQSCKEVVAPGHGCNLYAYDHGEVSFIAALNFLDNNNGENSNYGSWKASRSNRTAQVSPDGRYLAFMSFADLTGYDNRVAGGGDCLHSSGGPSCLEVFEYDLEGESLRCASCNPSGQRPLGMSNLSLIRPAFGPAPGTPFPQPENLSAGGEGRLFFESQDALSPKDTNGHIQDVYEWTPEGVGGCGRVAGCLVLISSGHDPNDSMFVTATPDARNAFFITREQLLPIDQDELLDVYDARIGAGLETGEVGPCSGESCKGPSTPAPPQPSSGSSQFSGPGNLKPKHGHHKKRKHQRKRPRHRSRAANHHRGGAK
jgi:hypothetical protein